MKQNETYGIKMEQKGNKLEKIVKREQNATNWNIWGKMREI